MDVYVADMDSDGDLDIVSASWQDDTIAWYENDGNANPSFTKHVVATSADGAYDVHVADMDSDGDLDIVSASLSTTPLLGTKMMELLTRPGPQLISPPVQMVPTMCHVADMDGDGDLDIVSASIRRHYCLV